MPPDTDRVLAVMRNSGVVRSGEVTAPTRGPAVREEAAWKSLLYRGASGAFLVQVAGAGLGLMVHIVLARLLGVNQYGIYTFALSWVSVIAVLALLGQDTSVLRFIAVYAHHGQWGELRGLRSRTSLISVVATGAIVIVGVIVIYLLRSRLQQSEQLTFFASFLLLPVLVQLRLNSAFLQGLKRAASSKAFNSIVRPLILLSLVLILGLGLGGRTTAPTVMLASVVAVLITVVLSEAFLRRVWPAGSKSAMPAYETRSWLRLGRQLFFLAAIGIALNRVDMLVLGGLDGSASVGPYFAAVQLATIALYGLNAVNTILAPMIAECYAAGEHARLKRLVHRAAWFTFVVTASVSLATAVSGRWLLELFGSGFVVAYVPLLIILGGQCVNAAAGPVGFLMTMTRFESQAPWIFGGGAVLNLLLSALLIPSLGIIGAAVATATATVTWNVSALVFVRRKLGVNPTVLPWPA